MHLTRTIGCLLALASALAWAGCEDSFFESGPAMRCTEVAAQCVLPDGPLGVCERTPCEAGSEAPCFVCTPQH
jgi:hypothetical protein